MIAAIALAAGALLSTASVGTQATRQESAPVSAHTSAKDPWVGDMCNASLLPFGNCAQTARRSLQSRPR